MKKELRRDPNNKIIAGVCSGIANYLEIDPVIIRLIWAAAIFWKWRNSSHIIC